MNRIRIFLLPILLVLAMGVLIASVQPHYPIQKWLFWHYALYWFLCFFWSLACLSGGHFILNYLLSSKTINPERFLLNFATGFFVFFLGLFVAGLLHLYGPVLFFLLPLSLVALGYRSFFAKVRQGLSSLLGSPISLSPMALFILMGGILGILMVYLPTLTPDNVAYDSRWYHLALAEHYAAQGGIHSFPEGWYLGAYPHLASILYTWAFLLPGLGLFDRIELAAHMEFTIFLWTLFSLPILVKWLVPEIRNASLSWVALFLFPGIFLYDSSLSVAADHIAAFWAIPIYLSMVRLYRDPRPTHGVLLAIMLSGAMLTKYQSLYLVAPAILVLGFCLLQGKIKAPLLSVLSVLILTTPHWLKNWVWYGDPFYPLLYKHLRLHPWTPDAATLAEIQLKDPGWTASGPFFQKILESLKVLFTFSFHPHDWDMFHGSVPVFGFLFTLLLFVLPFLKRNLRLWGLTLCTYLGIFLWYWTFHQDRYLQLLLPWMSAVTAASLFLLWKSGRITRVSLAGLIALQIIWGSDIYFFPTHSMMGQAPIKAVSDLISSGYQKNYENRYRIYGDLNEVGKILPKNSKVLIHEIHTRLGIESAFASDSPGYQGGISYGWMRSPDEIYGLLHHRYGITHLLWQTEKSMGWDSLAGDLQFFNFVSRYAPLQKRVGGLTIVELPPSPPPASSVLEEKDIVLFSGCGSTYQTGLYHLSQMIVSGLGPHSPSEYPLPFQSQAPTDQADFVVLDPSCPIHLNPEDLKDFFHAANRQNLQLWIRLSKP